MPEGVAAANSRLLPLWDLGLMIFAALGVGAGLRQFRETGVLRAVPLLLLVTIGTGFLAAGETRARAGVVLGGLDRLPAWSELASVSEALSALPGGRVAWEVFPGLVGYGSPFALQLLPYWTSGHVATLDGLHRESSATSPAVERVLSEISAAGRGGVPALV